MARASQVAEPLYSEEEGRRSIDPVVLSSDSTAPASGRGYVSFPEVETVAADAACKTPHICKKVFQDGRVLSTAYERPMTMKGGHPWRALDITTARFSRDTSVLPYHRPGWIPGIP